MCARVLGKVPMGGVAVSHIRVRHDAQYGISHTLDEVSE